MITRQAIGCSWLRKKTCFLKHELSSPGLRIYKRKKKVKKQENTHASTQKRTRSRKPARKRPRNKELGQERGQLKWSTLKLNLMERNLTTNANCLFFCFFLVTFLAVSSFFRRRFLGRVRVFLMEFFFAWTHACLRGRVRVYFLVHFLFFFYQFPAQEDILSELRR